MKFLTAASVVASTLAFSSTAFAETLNYDFTMTITSISDGYGVFSGLKAGDPLNVSVFFDTTADADGQANITVSGLNVASTGYWGSSWSDVQYNAGSWDAYSGTIADTLVVNGIGIHSGSVHEEVYLTFGQNSSGEFGIASGKLSIGVYNGSSAYLTANWVGTPTSTAVPELDPGSGTSALALLGGGLALAWSRRRQQLDAVAS